MKWHRHQEFIGCLNTIEADVPAGRLIHVSSSTTTLPTKTLGCVRGWPAICDRSSTSRRIRCLGSTRRMDPFLPAHVSASAGASLARWSTIKPPSTAKLLSITTTPAHSGHLREDPPPPCTFRLNRCTRCSLWDAVLPWLPPPQTATLVKRPRRFR
jgi:hypothetical protein